MTESESYFLVNGAKCYTTTKEYERACTLLVGKGGTAIKTQATPLVSCKSFSILYCYSDAAR